MYFSVLKQNSNKTFISSRCGTVARLCCDAIRKRIQGTVVQLCGGTAVKFCSIHFNRAILFRLVQIRLTFLYRIKKLDTFCSIEK